MEYLWNSRDRFPSSDQYMKVCYWEVPDLFEISVHKNNNMSQMPGEKVASFHMIREDVEKLIRTLEEFLSYTEGKE